MTARRPPAPAETDRANRTRGPFTASAMEIGTQLIFGADLVKVPGQVISNSSGRMKRCIS